MTTSNLKTVCFLLLGWLMLGATFAAEKKPQPPVVREILVPFDDLNVVLEADNRRVFLGREEYEELLKKAKENPPQPQAPRAVNIAGTRYDATIADGRARINAEIDVEVLNDGVHVAYLDLSGFGVRSAQWDQEPAALSRDPQGRLMLFASGKGRHTLALELTAAVSSSAAQQTLQGQLPYGPVRQITVHVAGNVELKGGAAVRSRKFDAEKNETVLDLLPHDGPLALVLSLNNRQKREDKVVVARSVFVDEFTEAYERLHAVVSFRVLHGAAEKLRLEVPAGFDVTDVHSPLAAKWTVADVDGKPTLELTLREPLLDTTTLTLSAVKQNVPLADWKFPQLKPLDVAGHVAVVGLLLEDRLRPGKMTTDGLLPIDASVLRPAIPAGVFEAEAGAVNVRTVAAYFAPTGEFALSGELLRPAAGTAVVASSLLLLEDRQLSLRGGFALTPSAEETFELRFLLPPEWQIVEVTAANDVKLPLEPYPLAGGGTRVLVRFPNGLPVGRATSVNFHATSTPKGWLGDWTERELEFPVVKIEGTNQEQGAIAVHSVDDMLVTPGKLTNLLPLLENEKADYGFADLPTTLAYYYETTPYAAALTVQRAAPSLTASTMSFFRIERDHTAAHYELTYAVRESRTREVSFSLPKDTPNEIAVRGSGVAVKDYTSRLEDDRRVWRVILGERVAGDVKLIVEFPYKHSEESQALALPLIRAEGVDYQNALVAVEGTPELDIEVLDTKGPRGPRKVDVGELFGGEYQLGRRVVGAFGYTGTEAELKVNVTRRRSYDLPSALVERAELVTLVDVSGRSVSAVRYLLRTRATLLEVELPPGAELWTAKVDGAQSKPQHVNKTLLLTIPAAAAEVVRDLQLVYETPAKALALSGGVDQGAPQLRLPDPTGAVEIATADLQWELWMPNGYRVTRSNGAVFTDAILRRESPAVATGRRLLNLFGGIGRRSTSPAGWGAYPAAKSEANFEYGYTDAYGVPESTAAPAAGQPALGPLKDNSESLARRDEQGERKPAEPRLTPPPVEMPAPAKPATPPPPVSTPTPNAEDGVKQGEAAQHWALEGLPSLPIELQPTSLTPVVFNSLGERPRLQATLVEDRRLENAAAGVGLLIGLIGIALTFRPATQRVGFVVAVLALASVLAWLPGPFVDLHPIFDAAFFAGTLVAIYLLVAALLCGLIRRVKHLLPACTWCASTSDNVRAAGTSAAILLALSLASSTASAQTEIKNLKDLLPLLEAGGGPVKVPHDAIIIPFDPEVEGGAEKAEKVLVPYEKYIELFNRANPGKKPDGPRPPADYAFAGGSYEARLGAEEQLILTGKLVIQVYSNKPVAIPLALDGGVLAEAKVDGAPARLQVVEPQPPTAPQAQPPQQQKAVQQFVPPPPARPLLLLHLSGEGRKTLQFSVRFPVTRQGGWRIVQGKLPVAAATSATFVMPEAGGEVRLGNIPDRPATETKAADEKIETALADNGDFRVEWRTRQADSLVDQSLAVKSLALLDLRDDAVRLAQQFNFEFGRGMRESFELSAPADYFVERVGGENVRGWQSRVEDGRQRIDVTLLKGVIGRESIVIHLAKRGTVGGKEFTEIAAPVVTVVGAALQQGDLQIRKSPRLDVQVKSSSGLSRADLTAFADGFLQEVDRQDVPVLPLRAFQAFHFSTANYALTLTATPLAATVSAEIQALLRIAERKVDLEAKIRLRSTTAAPIYRLRLRAPLDWQIEPPTGDDIDWSVTPDANGQTVQVLFPDGRLGAAEVTLRGRLAKHRAADEVTAPKLEVLDVERQDGELVVQADPEIDVTVKATKNCDAVTGMQTFGWLRVDQAALARAGIRFRSPAYEATFALTARDPVVTVKSVTNAKVTRQSIAQTSVLDYHIEQAGISEIVFQLPSALAKARIRAPLLRQKVVTSVENDSSRVRVRLLLQDSVIGDYRVMIESDRPADAEKQTVALPRIETGRPVLQLVAFESAGRDEVVVDSHAGLDAVGRQQPAWRDAAAYLSGITELYAASGDKPAELAFHLQDRERVKTADARIGLAETLLVFDAAGGFRGMQQYRVENFTEQYLDVQMPPGAELWTAFVAGEPVKPARGAAADIVRIPLVKSAEGEADYGVVLKFGGRAPAPTAFTAVKFPLPKSLNIKAEQSQVRLYLPETHEWLNFAGSMRQVDEGTLAVGFNDYLHRQLMTCTSALSSANPFTKARATNNLKQLSLAIDNFNIVNDTTVLQQERVREAQTRNSALLQEGQQQALDQLAELEQGQTDNRDRLNAYFEAQTFSRSKNVVGKSGSNFSGPSSGGAAKSEFNPNWFAGNGLIVDGKDGKPMSKKAKDMRETAENKRVVQRGRAVEQQPQTAQSKAPQAAGGKQLLDLQKQIDNAPNRPQVAKGAQLDDQSKAQRYQAELDERNKSDFAQNAAPQQQLGGFQNGGQFNSQLGDKAAGQGGGLGGGGAGGNNFYARGGEGRGVQSRQDGNGQPLPPGVNGPAPAAAVEFDRSGAVAQNELSRQTLEGLNFSNGRGPATRLPSGPTGFASLDLEIPQRGKAYFFTTPRGEIAITARAVDRSLLRGVLGLAAAVAAIVVGYLLLRNAGALGAALRKLDSLAVDVLLTLVGLLAWLVGFLPLLAAGIFVLGLVRVILRLLERRAARVLPVGP